MAAGTLVPETKSALSRLDQDWLEDQTDKIRQNYRNVLEVMLENGRIIARVRERIGHGNFIPWVTLTLGMSLTTANNWTRSAAWFDALEGRQVSRGGMFEPEAIQKLSQPSIPEQVRELAMKAAEQGSLVDLARVKKIIAAVNGPAVDPDTSDQDTPASPPATLPLSATPPNPTVTTCERCRALMEALVPREGQIEWAEAIAGGVATHYDLSPDRREDVKQKALLQMLTQLESYDPTKCPSDGSHVGAFRGWAHDFVSNACEREALRLMNGGTYNTTRTPEQAPRVVSLPEESRDAG